MVITEPQIIDPEIVNYFDSLPTRRFKEELKSLKIGDSFTTPDGKPGVMVSARVAEVVSAGLKAQRDERRRKQRVARASRRRNR